MHATPFTLIKVISFLSLLCNLQTRQVLNINSRARALSLSLSLTHTHTQVWNLRRPQVVISMLGSTFDFDMDGEDRIKLLNDLMLVAKETNAWVITLVRRTSSTHHLQYWS